jgi:ABC-2 type transport system ATP-binding protein
MLALGTPHQVRAQAGEGAGADMNSAFIAIVEHGRASAGAAA